MRLPLSRRDAMATVAGGALALGVAGGARAAPGDRLARAAEIGRLLAAALPAAERDRLATAVWDERLRDGAPVAALLREVRTAAARDFSNGAVVALDGARLAHAEAAFALACHALACHAHACHAPAREERA
jgi:hypothetical protein